MLLYESTSHIGSYIVGNYITIGARLEISSSDALVRFELSYYEIVIMNLQVGPYYLVNSVILM